MSIDPETRAILQETLRQTEASARRLQRAAWRLRKILAGELAAPERYIDCAASGRRIYLRRGAYAPPGAGHGGGHEKDKTDGH